MPGRWTAPGFAEFGDPEGKPLVYCHGFPASRLEAALLDPAARKARVRIVAADRPGCGLSDFQPDRGIGTGRAMWSNLQMSSASTALPLWGCRAARPTRSRVRGQFRGA